MSNYSVGDAVVLTTGGPAMSVTKVDNENKTVVCCWFGSDTDLLYEYEFPFGAIEDFEEEDE